MKRQLTEEEMRCKNCKRTTGASIIWSTGEVICMYCGSKHRVCVEDRE